MVAKTHLNHRDVPIQYVIQIQGRLDPGWSAWFDNLEMKVDQPKAGPTITVLTGPVVDQVALHSLLNRIYDLGMELVLVRRMDTGEQAQTDQPDKGE